MTDLNSRIAARREELARLERQAKVEKEAAEARQRADAARALSEELSDDGVEAAVKGGQVQLVHEPDVSDFSPDMHRREREQLISREVRRLWTTRDQWTIISLIAGGVCLIHLGGFGLLLVVFGLALRHAVNKRCREELQAICPVLFVPADAGHADGSTITDRLGGMLTGDRK